jgi:hypothetical protein
MAIASNDREKRAARKGENPHRGAGVFFHSVFMRIFVMLNRRYIRESRYKIKIMENCDWQNEKSQTGFAVQEGIGNAVHFGRRAMGDCCTTNRSAGRRLHKKHFYHIFPDCGVKLAMNGKLKLFIR